MGEEAFRGGITNTGEVVRDGSHVVRPATPHTESVHRFLRALGDTGFRGAPMPIGIDSDGRERLSFVEGDVPVVPYPDWSQSDAALASVARLLREMHDAAAPFDGDGLSWNDALADPAGGNHMCHNDVELSNVVFRDGLAVALIDFEFAAPGRPIYDLAQLARLCVPIEDDFDKARMGWNRADGPARLRLVADEYGLDRANRQNLLLAMDDAIDRIEQSTLRALQLAPEQTTTSMAKIGGIEKYKRRREWWQRHQASFAHALK